MESADHEQCSSAYFSISGLISVSFRIAISNKIHQVNKQQKYTETIRRSLLILSRPRESPVVIWFFKWYTWFFMQTSVSREFFLPAGSCVDRNQSVLFVLNHHSWWDGLIPLLLNEFVFRQRASCQSWKTSRCVNSRFFSRIGAMSVNRVNPRSALYTLTLASQWLPRIRNQPVFVPGRKNYHPALPIEIESGFLRISQQAPGSLLIPVALFISHRKSS